MKAKNIFHQFKIGKPAPPIAQATCETGLMNKIVSGNSAELKV